MGWGSWDQIMNVDYSTNKFLEFACVEAYLPLVHTRLTDHLDFYTGSPPRLRTLIFLRVRSPRWFSAPSSPTVTTRTRARPASSSSAPGSSPVVEEAEEAEGAHRTTTSSVVSHIFAAFLYLHSLSVFSSADGVVLSPIGDVCWAIAQRFGISVATLQSWNPAINGGCTNLAIGQTLCVRK